MSRKKIKLKIKDRVFCSSLAARQYAELRYKEAAQQTGFIFKIKIWYWYNGGRSSAIIELGHKVNQPHWKDGS